MVAALAVALFFAATAAAQEAPGRPTNLKATAASSLSVALTWKAPAGSDVAGYQILRRRPNEGERRLLVHVANTGSTDSTWSESGLTPEVAYIYRVRAVSVQGVTSQASNRVLEETKPTPAPTLENTAETAPGPETSEQSATTDYDTDDDGLIEINSLAKLDAIRYDTDGDGTTSTADATAYSTAFPIPRPVWVALPPPASGTS